MQISRNYYLTKFGKLIKLVLPDDLVVPILSGKLRGKKWILGSGNLEYALGTYERKKVIFFQKIATKSCVIYDLGAHAGFYTILASQLVNRKIGKVVAFEPQPRNIEFLKKHINMNRCGNVIIYEAAVSDKNGLASFDDGPNSFMGHLSERSSSIIVKLVSIDNLIKNNNIPPPDCIKMDIEGAELLALNGAKSSLIRYHPKLLIATHGKVVHEECCKFLFAIGYKLMPIVGSDLSNSSEIFAYFGLDP